MPIAECVRAAYTSVVKNYPLLVSNYLNYFIKEKWRNHVLHFHDKDQLYLLDCQHMILPFVRQVCIIETVLAMGLIPKQEKINMLLEYFDFGGWDLSVIIFVVSPF